MKTAITDMFGIDLPILAFTHCRDVVVAVSKAGGMGVLGAAAHSDRQLEIDLDWIEAELGDRPYGVDLIVPAKYAGSDEGGLTMTALRDMIPAGHRQFVDDILDRYGVPELPARRRSWRPDRRQRGSPVLGRPRRPATRDRARRTNRCCWSTPSARRRRT